MKSIKQLLSLASCAMIFASPITEAEAGQRNQRVKRTEVRQQARIRQGVKSGELTRDEAKGLRQDNKDINQMRKEAKGDDGKIDNVEMKQIRQEQKQNSENIRAEKHDEDKR